ncbi:unnamed protein product [Arctogadus glacialis]
MMDVSVQTEGVDLATGHQSLGPGHKHYQSAGARAASALQAWLGSAMAAEGTDYQQGRGYGRQRPQSPTEPGPCCAAGPPPLLRVGPRRYRLYFSHVAPDLLDAFPDPGNGINTSGQGASGGPQPVTAVH